MKLYHTPRAPNPERVVYFARAKSILDKLDLVDVSIMDGEHLSEDYAKISPLNQVPALVLEDGTALTESRAICTYLEGLYPSTNLLGETPLEKAQIEMWERRIEMKVFFNIAGWFRHGHPAMAPLESPQIPAFSEASFDKLKTSLAWFAQHLEGRDFILDRFTNADIFLHVSQNFCGPMKYKPQDEFPALGAHYTRMKGYGLYRLN